MGTKIHKVKSEEVVNNFIDAQTGELIEQTVDIKHHKIVVTDKETFFQTYSAVMSLTEDLTKTERRLLDYACLNAQFNKNIIGLGKPICDDITKSTGLTYQTIKDTISTLKSKNVFIAQGSGYYRINPKYYWKGTSTERLKTMRFIFEVECPDCISDKDLKVAVLEENKEFLKEA